MYIVSVFDINKIYNQIFYFEIFINNQFEIVWYNIILGWIWYRVS